MDFLWIFLIALQQKIKWNYAHLHLNSTQLWDKFFPPILHSLLTYILGEMKFQVTVYFLDNVWGRNIIHTIIFTSTKVWLALEAMSFKEYEPKHPCLPMAITPQKHLKVTVHLMEKWNFSKEVTHFRQCYNILQTKHLNFKLLEL